ncbi:MAG: TonB-dependent receptor plug domain-containing protein [Mesorhizobium sp.]
MSASKRLREPAQATQLEWDMGIFRQSSLLLACGVATGVVIFSQAAMAQGGTEVELAPVVVEGAQQQLPTDQPIQKGTETKIQRPAIQKRMVEDFNDLGRRVDAGVNFDNNSNSINLRGLQDDRVLTTIDGVRVPWLVDPRDSAKGGLNAFDFEFAVHARHRSRCRIPAASVRALWVALCSCARLIPKI